MLGEMDLPDDEAELNQQRMRHMVAIEELEARGMQYSNQDCDVLSGALTFAARTKTHRHCKSPGCLELGTFQPHVEFDHVLFCQKHAAEMFRQTVKLIG
jgi:hypothetical protein